MRPKQAIVYNVVSSVLAFCGMLIGVMLGNIESASLWIFTVVGGMFLYVSLVDMVIPGGKILNYSVLTVLRYMSIC